MLLLSVPSGQVVWNHLTPEMFALVRTVPRRFAWEKLVELRSPPAR